MKDRLTTPIAQIQKGKKERQRVSDRPPLRHAVILILKKPNLVALALLTFEDLPKAVPGASKANQKVSILAAKKSKWSGTAVLCGSLSSSSRA
jgi:hypothetical protein